MANVKVPGVGWAALAGMLATWLTQYVDAPWAVAAVAALSAAGVAVEHFVKKRAELEGSGPQPDAPQAAPMALGMAASAGKARKGSTVVRWLFG